TRRAEATAEARRQGRDSTASRRPGGNAQDVYFPTEQGQATGGATARRSLSAAYEPGGGGSSGAVGPLHAVGANRSGIQVSEERLRHSPDLSPTGASRRCPYSGRLSGVLSNGDAETPIA